MSDRRHTHLLSSDARHNANVVLQDRFRPESTFLVLQGFGPGFAFPRGLLFPGFEFLRV